MALLELMPYIANQVSNKYATAVYELLKDIPFRSDMFLPVTNKYIIFYITKDGEAGYIVSYNRDDVGEATIKYLDGEYVNYQAIAILYRDIDFKYDYDGIEIPHTDSKYKTVIATLFSC